VTDELESGRRLRPSRAAGEKLCARPSCRATELQDRPFESPIPANRGAGLVYELFKERFLLAMDGFLERLDPALHDIAIRATSGMYIPPSERREEAEGGELDDGSYMRTSYRHQTYAHYLDPHVCPIGCGDLDFYSLEGLEE
jgi:hypothetical protein